MLSPGPVSRVTEAVTPMEGIGSLGGRGPMAPLTPLAHQEPADHRAVMTLSHVAPLGPWPSGTWAASAQQEGDTDTQTLTGKATGVG